MPSSEPSGLPNRQSWTAALEYSSRLVGVFLPQTSRSVGFLALPNRDVRIHGE
jgi:hypothetical protein